VHDVTKLELPADKYDLVYHDWYRIYKNRSEVFQVGCFPKAMVLDDDRAVLSLLTDPSFFDPRRVLLLTKTPDTDMLPDKLTATPISIRIEAEKYVSYSAGVVESARSASEGKYLANRGKRPGHLATYSVDLPRDLEQCTFAVSYCSAEGVNAGARINLTNGASVTSHSLTLSPTKDWKSGWRIASVKLDQLSKGHNTLTIESSSQADVNIDAFYIIEHLPAATGDNSASLRVIDYNPTSILIEALTDRDGFLFLNEIHYPGWKAYVDGQEQPIFKANSIFRAVYLKAGNHKVTFKFQPASFYIGAVITFVTIVAVAIYFLRAFLKKPPSMTSRG
ncbi:MAG: YfhO family protein, partial [Nitrososphaera sp.]